MFNLTTKFYGGIFISFFLLILLISFTISHTDPLTQADTFYWRGDVNLNEYAFEISDVICFRPCFLSGHLCTYDQIGIDNYWYGISIQASDVNFDNIPLTLSDFVFIAEVVKNEALPWDTVSPSDDTVYVDTATNGNQIIVSSTSPDTIGGIVLVFSSTSDISNLVNHSDMAFDWHQESGQLRVLLWSLFPGEMPVPPGTVELFSFECDGKVVIDSLAAANSRAGEMHCPFTLCGDVNVDGYIDLSDVIYLANYYLEGGPPPPDPIWRANANGDYVIDLSDVIYLAKFKLTGGPQPHGCGFYEP